MNYWITTHWPLHRGETHLTSTGIWLPEGRQAPGAAIAPDDLVLIYESKTGPITIKEGLDGSLSKIHHQRGQQGVICIARVTRRIAADPSSREESYVGRKPIWWRYHAPAKVLSRSGFVSSTDVAVILGYKRNYKFRGFGDRHSGLRRISKEQYEQIVERFLKGRPITSRQGLTHPGGYGGGGGESDIHRDLKEFIAANPSIALGEQGLSTIMMEYTFPTGDRADIALEDEYGRVIGVEIEPEVMIVNHPGPLQAIKYRYMLEWTTDRTPGDSRAMLIAHKISEGVRQRSKFYGVECHEISRQRVLDWLNESSESEAPS